jgi:hypothetical protein
MLKEWRRRWVPHVSSWEWFSHRQHRDRFRLGRGARTRAALDEMKRPRECSHWKSARNVLFRNWVTCPLEISNVQGRVFVTIAWSLGYSIYSVSVEWFTHQWSGVTWSHRKFHSSSKWQEIFFMKTQRMWVDQQASVHRQTQYRSNQLPELSRVYLFAVLSPGLATWRASVVRGFDIKDQRKVRMTDLLTRRCE